LAILASKNISDTPTKPTEAEVSFRKVSVPPAKPCMFFPAHLWVRKFGHKSTPSDRPWIEAYCPKFYTAENIEPK